LKNVHQAFLVETAKILNFLEYYQHFWLVVKISNHMLQYKQMLRKMRPATILLKKSQFFVILENHTFSHFWAKIMLFRTFRQKSHLKKTHNFFLFFLHFSRCPVLSVQVVHIWLLRYYNIMIINDLVPGVYYKPRHMITSPACEKPRTCSISLFWEQTRPNIPSCSGLEWEQVFE